MPNRVVCIKVNAAWAKSTSAWYSRSTTLLLKQTRLDWTSGWQLTYSQSSGRRHQTAWWSSEWSQSRSQPSSRLSRSPTTINIFITSVAYSFISAQYRPTVSLLHADFSPVQIMHKFSEVSQCCIEKRHYQWPWVKVNLATVRRPLNKAAQINDVPTPDCKLQRIQRFHLEMRDLKNAKLYICPAGNSGGTTSTELRNCNVV